MIVHANKYRKINPALLAQIVGAKPNPLPPKSALVGRFISGGGDFVDYSGNGNNLIDDGYSASTFPTNGAPAVAWNGSSRTASAASASPVLQFSGLGTPFTLTAWVAGIYDAGAMINTQDSTNGYQGYGFYCYTPQAGEVYFNLVNRVNSYAVDAYSNTGGTIDPSLPHFFAVTYDGSQVATGINIFVDGVQVATTPGGAGLLGQDCTSGAPFTVGSLPNLPFSYGLQGQQAETRVYNIALKLSQVAALYAIGPQSS